MKFYLPNFNIFSFQMIEYLRNNKERFQDEVEIGGVYGCFNGMKWNGGRAISTQRIEIENIIKIIDNFNSCGIPLRFTLTNTKLTVDDIYDEYCNEILKEANKRGINEAIVNDKRLENHIRKYYSNIKIISSTTKCIRDINVINEDVKQYHMVVTDYRDNNIDFLLHLDNKDKIELLLNAYCSPNCQRRLEHYDYLSEAQIGKDVGTFSCDCMYNSFYDILKYPTVIKRKFLYDVLVPMGFSNFKIEGRTTNIVDLVESYIYYMVKEEWFDIVRNDLLKLGFSSIEQSVYYITYDGGEQA